MHETVNIPEAAAPTNLTPEDYWRFFAPGAVTGPATEPRHVTAQRFKDETDAILLLGLPVAAESLGGETLPDPDLGRTVQTTLLGLIHESVVKSAHGGGDGGLARALTTGCVHPPADQETLPNRGALVDLTAIEPTTNHPADTSAVPPPPSPRLAALLLGHAPDWALISVAATDAGRVVKQARIMGVPATLIGKVGGDTLVVKTAGGEFTTPVAELHDAWWDALARAMA